MSRTHKTKTFENINPDLVPDWSRESVGAPRMRGHGCHSLIAGRQVPLEVLYTLGTLIQLSVHRATTPIPCSGAGFPKGCRVPSKID